LFHRPATTVIYTLSLHDALPIYPVSRGRSGEFISTGLLNADMPLIRYRAGDRGALPGEEHPCQCGRTLPTVAYIEGRMDDVLYTDRKSTRLNSSHLVISYAVFCL